MNRARSAAQRAGSEYIESENDDAKTIPPLLHPAIAKLIFETPDMLRSLIGRHGSPLNLMWPQILAENVESMRSTLRRQGLPFALFYGAKANKSPALVRAAVEAGIGVDVSSVYEMRDALQAGIDGRMLCATGPAKTRAFHAALIANDALIAVDSPEELDDLEALVCVIAADHPTRVLLRYRPHGQASSRFGMSVEALVSCLQRLAAMKQTFAFEGFHFHVGGYRYEARVEAIRELVEFIDMARGLGLAPSMIDIGGGLPVRYVDAGRYTAFLRAQQPHDYRTGKVPASFYPYGGELGAQAWLDRLLASPCIGQLSVARWLGENGLTLAIEPGRSLADQTGISVFRVTRAKTLAGGVLALFVEGSSFSACETWFASEFLVDPILVAVPRNDAPASTPVRAFIAGHSCLDDDVITHRLVHFPAMPQAGDLLVYANTAGYQMDLLENEFHRHPMPRRLAVGRDAAGGTTTSPDDCKEYWDDFS